MPRIGHTLNDCRVNGCPEHAHLFTNNLNPDDARPSEDRPHPTLSQPWGDPDYDPTCPRCQAGRHGRLAVARPSEDRLREALTTFIRMVEHPYTGADGMALLADPYRIIVKEAKNVLAALAASRPDDKAEMYREMYKQVAVEWAVVLQRLGLAEDATADDVLDAMSIPALAASRPAPDSHDTLARAILIATKEDGRRPTSDGFEWYGSADELAAGILSALEKNNG